VPAIFIILLSLAGVLGMGWYALSVPLLQVESIGLWVSCVGLILYSVIEEKHDAIVLNGVLMAFYLAFMTSMDLTVLT
jgi:hypothetical protein